jgi:hypothetical protein
MHGLGKERKKNRYEEVAESTEYTEKKRPTTPVRKRNAPAGNPRRRRRGSWPKRVRAHPSLKNAKDGAPTSLGG